MASKKSNLEEEERNKLIEREKKIEEAFISEENKAVRQEQNDQLHTKRLIDNMMLAEPKTVNKEVCELLANFKGNFSWVCPIRPK